jgi:D-3-phosphoglycerate dehydrogenase / 2-oxoglutarate reductase
MNARAGAAGNAERIAVTPRSLSRGGHPALEPLVAAGYELVFPSPGRQPTLAEQLAVLPSCVGYLAGVECIPGELLRECPALHVISRNGVGTDAIDVETAREMGIAIATTPGANARGVAELTIALMFAGLRHVPWSDKALKRGAWQRREGLEVRGRTLGVIGCGHIGRRVVEMGLGLGMLVRAHDQVEDPAFQPPGDFAYTELGALLGQADVVSLHCPPGPRPLIDAAALAAFKRGAYLINTARAALVDEEAVFAALEHGILAGFATDVYGAEPPEVTDLLRRDDVICMPHAGGFTAESVRRAAAMAVGNLLAALEGDASPAARPQP